MPPRKRAASQKVHDPRVLRAIAHPMRNRIMSELAAVGTMRAADVAKALDIPANQASFHLRQLAQYGMVEEAPEEARDKRDRVWRLVVEEGYAIDVKEMAAAPGGKAAVGVWRREAAARAHEIVDAAYAFELSKKDRRFQSISDWPIRLTPKEGKQLAAEIDELLLSWRHRTQGDSDDERTTYQLFQILQPYPDEGGSSA